MDPKKFEMMRKLYEEQIPFNKLIGMEIIGAEGGKASLRFDFRLELVGNFKMGILHGGVIAAVLDVVGGAAVISGFGAEEPLHGMGTVDLRVDYLRPGSGQHFIATGEVMRQGRILSATRMTNRSSLGLFRTSARTRLRNDRRSPASRAGPGTPIDTGAPPLPSIPESSDRRADEIRRTNSSWKRRRVPSPLA